MPETYEEKMQRLAELEEENRLETLALIEEIHGIAYEHSETFAELNNRFVDDSLTWKIAIAYERVCTALDELYFTIDDLKKEIEKGATHA